MEQRYDLRKRDFIGFAKTEKPQIINSNAQGMGYGTWNTRGCVVVHPLVRPEKQKPAKRVDFCGTLPGKMRIFFEPYDLGKLGFSLLKPQVNRVPGSAVGIPRGGGRRKPHPESTRKPKVKTSQ